MSNFRQRSIFGVLVVVFGALLFTVASAFIIDRGYPKLLAGIVGGLAFPVLPVAWQIWGERRRKARLAQEKKPSKSQLTGRDRFWFRFIGIALLIVGPMVAMQKFGVVRAAIKHGLWYLPVDPPGVGIIGGGERRSLTRLAPLLQRVPGVATTVVAYTPKENGEGLLAFYGHNIMGASQGDIGRDAATALEQVNAFLAVASYLGADKLSMVFDRDIALAASSGWEAKVEPAPNAMAAALRRELERAPEESLWSVARVPDRDKSVVAEAAWVTQRGSEYVVEARVEAKDVGQAYGLIEAFRKRDAKMKALALSADCQAELAKMTEKLELAQFGAVVTLRTTVGPDFIRAFESCKL